MSADLHDRVSALLDQYALGQLSPEERREVDEHVRECAACRAELRELRLVLEGLGRAPESVTPPPALKARVLDTLVRTPQPRAAVPSATTFNWRPWLAAAAVLIVGLSAVLYMALERERKALDDLRFAQAQTADVRARLDDYAGQTDLALSILTASDMRRIELAGSDGWRASVARAYWSPSRGLFVVADNLPVPPPGRIYQVWVIGGKTPFSAGLLGSQSAGRGMLIAAPPRGVAPGPITVAVTDEPPGGLPAPSGGIRLAGSL